jgi:serine/threonine protein kinase
MEQLDHPNCVNLIALFQSPKKVYMVLELLTGGELFDRIISKGSFSEKEASDLMGTLTSAIKYLHGVGIVHRDLKPENLLYSSQADDAQIKVMDFGLAKAHVGSEKNTMQTACGTPGYVAPEVLKNKPYGPAVDMWSLGVILYILLCGFPPFYHQDTPGLYKLIKEGKFDFPDPWWTKISPDAKDLVTKMLTLDPAKRATPDMVLSHPWISSGQASSAPLDNSKRLQMLQAKAKLRKGVKAIIAIGRFVDKIQTC